MQNAKQAYLRSFVFLTYPVINKFKQASKSINRSITSVSSLVCLIGMIGVFLPNYCAIYFWIVSLNNSINDYYPIHVCIRIIRKTIKFA